MNQPWVGQLRWMGMNGIFKRQHLNNQFKTHLWGSNCWVSRVHAIAELKNVNWQNFVENLKQANMYWWAILHNLPPAIYYWNDNRSVRMELVKLKSPGKIARNCLRGAPGLSSSNILDDLQSAKLVLTIMTSILILGLLGYFPDLSTELVLTLRPYLSVNWSLRAYLLNSDSKMRYRHNKHSVTLMLTRKTLMVVIPL